MIATALADWSFEAPLTWEPVPAWDATLTEESLRRLLPFRRRFSRQSDIERREDLQVDEASTTDVAALPGRVITTDLLLKEANKKRLILLIERFLSNPLTWGPVEPIRISEETRLAASRFIELLPDEVSLPQIAPDGEGGIVMHWQRGVRHILGGVDGWRLHLVVDAGQAHARYVDDVSFSGERLPEQILSNLMP